MRVVFSQPKVTHPDADAQPSPRAWGERFEGLLLREMKTYTWLLFVCNRCHAIAELSMLKGRGCGEMLSPADFALSQATRADLGQGWGLQSRPGYCFREAVGCRQHSEPGGPKKGRWASGVYCCWRLAAGGAGASWTCRVGEHSSGCQRCRSWFVRLDGRCRHQAQKDECGRKMVAPPKDGQL